MIKITKKVMGLILIAVIFLAMALPAAYAVVSNDADIVISITNKVESSSQSLDFHMADGSDYSGEWHPGMAMKSVVHLTNGRYFKRVTLANLGVWINNLDENSRAVFANNMLLTIKQGTNPDFGTTLYDGTLSGILYQHNSTVHTGKNIDLVIGSFGSTDLEYTLAMADNAGSNMQGLTAELSFFFNMNNVRRSNNNNNEEENESNSSGGTSTTPPSPAFLLENGNWYDDCIKALVANGIILPDVDGEIRPEDLITRGEAAVLVGRALKLGEDPGTTGYLDNIPEQYQGYVTATSKAKIFRGYPIISELLPGKIFRPLNNITREELFCVLVRAYSENTGDNTVLEFTDQNDIASWALGDIRTGVQQNIVGGYPDKSFKPKQYMSRAEAFSLVCRILGYHDHGSAGGGTR